MERSALRIVYRNQSQRRSTQSSPNAAPPLPTSLTEQMQMLAFLDPLVADAIREYVTRQLASRGHEVHGFNTQKDIGWGWQS